MGLWPRRSTTPSRSTTAPPASGSPAVSSCPNPFWFDFIPGAAPAPAVRWVRNAVQHKWLDALVLDPHSHDRYPLRPHEWVWRAAAEIPGPRQSRRRKREDAPKRDLVAEGYRAYAQTLEGRPADFTLQVLAEAYAEVADLHEPYRAPSLAAA